jgi:DNA-binding CsgD family transcriptional regulator
VAGRVDRLRALVDQGLTESVSDLQRGHLLALKAEFDRDRRVGHQLALDAAALLAPHDPAAAIQALAVAMRAGISARSTDLVRASAHHAILVSVPAGTLASYRQDNVVGMALAVTGELPDALAALNRVIAAVERDRSLREDPVECLHAVIAAGTLGLMTLAAELADTAMVAAHRGGNLGTLPDLMAYAGEAAAHRGEWTHAIALLTEAAGLFEAMGDPDGQTATLAYLAELHLHRGELEAAEHAAELRLRWAEPRGISRDRPPAIRVLATLQMWARRPELALRRLVAEANEPFYGRGVRRGQLTVVEDLVDAALLTREPDAAREPCQRLSAYAEMSPDPLASALAARCRAQLATDSDAEKEYRAALGFHEQDPHVFATARTELRFGEFLRRKARKTEAKEHLYAAQSAFDRLEAKPWAEQARAELRAAGESLGPRSAAREKLTPRQTLIAEAVVDGLTNGQVAKQLFVSVKTVENELTKIYEKLGVASRTQLARHQLFGGPGAG